MDELRERLEEVERRLGRVEAERAIERLMHRYVHAIDVIKDAEVTVGFFAPGAVWEGRGNLTEFRADGLDEIREMFHRNPSMLPFTAHFLTNPVIDVSPDGAQARGCWHALEAATLFDGETAVWLIAHYDNDFVRRQGEWKIACLRFEDRVICPYEEGWARTRYVSPVTLERVAQPRPTVPGEHPLTASADREEGQA